MPIQPHHFRENLIWWGGSINECIGLKKDNITALK
jgi:hypothetical protein